MDTAAVEDYINELKSQLKSGHAKEHAYRPALQRLMRTFPDVEAINDPAQSEYGAPDFIFQKKSNRDITLGYAEAKDLVGAQLDRVEQSDQMRRYAGYQNLFLTDYVEFRFFRNGFKYDSVTIGTVEDGMLHPAPEMYQTLVNALRDFLNLPPEPITSGKSLSEIMGAKTRRIRDDIETFFNDDEDATSELNKIFRLMKTMLVHDLDRSKFADMYAQTLVYGLFVARYSDKTPDTFNRFEARDLIPNTNPFLRQFSDHIVGSEFDERLSRAVDELCDAFRVSDVRTIVHRYYANSDDIDPIIHFYEDFLKAYDPEVRRRMGAYYTPLAIVRYIIRQVDNVLQTQLGVSQGLADTHKIPKNHRSYLADMDSGAKTKKYKDVKIDYSRVQVLDPAVGTGTFLNEIVQYVHQTFVKNGQEGRWPSYASDNLIPRLSGFELMMAPYTISHLKLGMTLESTGAQLPSSRLGIYLANSLEEGVPHQPDLFSLGLMEAVTEEARLASEIKNDRPVMVIVGNPPYSAISSNETEFANNLVRKYKVEPGGHSKLNERKHWLNDDYVKFMALAEDMIKNNGSGIVAMITNHAYLDNATFRGMRWHLARTFDTIQIVDLHGNVAKREQAPDGRRNENVFNITQGVAIIVATRLDKDHTDKPANVHYAHLWGTRKEKLHALSTDQIEWQQLSMNKRFDFVPRSSAGIEAYENGISLDQLFHVFKTGLVTMGDPFIVAESENDLRLRLMELKTSPPSEEELKRKYGLGKNYAKWVTSNLDSIGPYDPAKVVRYAYRPFDTRYTYFDTNLIWRWRIEMAKHVVAHENLSLVISRQAITDNWSHIQFVDTITDNRFQYSNKGIPVQIPLYLYDEDGTPRSNLVLNSLKRLCTNLSAMPETLDIPDYIYGVLHSPQYRCLYSEYLKLDFPRVPIPSNDVEFQRYADIGGKLRSVHLDSETPVSPFATYPNTGSDLIEKVKYVDQRVYINDSQYFGDVPRNIWDFYLSRYQPAQKWLKDRLGRFLTNEDLDHYQSILGKIKCTIEIMQDMDSEPKL